MKMEKNTSPYPSAMPLLAVERVTKIGHNILRQPNRRASLGFVDCPKPSYCSDDRLVFITGSSVEDFLDRQKAMKKLNKYGDPTCLGS